MKYRIKHITEYQYADRVSNCYNLAHLIPRSTKRQTRIKASISVSPTTGYHSRRQDYFGNEAYHFEIQRPHDKLIITSISEVITEAQESRHDLDFGVSCAEAHRVLKESKLPDVIMAREFMLNSPMAKTMQALADYARPSFSDNRPLLSSVSELTERIFSEFKYSPQATTVATPLSEVLEKKHGVCQDFTHLFCAIARQNGIPARYVSGYLHQGNGYFGDSQMHAWAEVFIPNIGWVGFDPTNNIMANTNHIKVSHGKDYNDCSPLRGVVYTTGRNETTHSVNVSSQQQQ